jgi:hypothetical protein
MARRNAKKPVSRYFEEWVCMCWFGDVVLTDA